MTEDEAKKNLCCGPRVIAAMNSILSGKSGLTTDEAETAMLCAGSGCMAWRWDEPWTSQTEEGHGGDIVIRLKRKAGEPRLGFCGLAGTPR